jgi:hypothetical protein
MTNIDTNTHMSIQPYEHMHTPYLYEYIRKTESARSRSPKTSHCQRLNLNGLVSPLKI